MQQSVISGSERPRELVIRHGVVEAAALTGGASFVTCQIAW